MATNTNWVKIVEGKFNFAESFIVHDGRIIINPTDEERIAAGELPMAHNAPETREGYTSRQTGYEARDGQIFAVYEYSAVTPSPVLISKSKVESVVDQMGKTAAFMAWLNSKAQYIGAWLRGGDDIAYDPADNSSDLSSLMSALGIGAEEIGGLIQQVVA